MRRENDASQRWRKVTRRGALRNIGIAISAASLSASRVKGGVLQHPTIGWLGIAGEADTERFVHSFESGMLNAGLQSATDFSIVIRSTKGDNAQLDVTAHELVAMQPRLIVAEGTRGAAAALRATPDIPIIGPTMGESMAIELAGAGFNRPRANVTGITVSRASAPATLISLLRQIQPTARRLGALVECALSDYQIPQLIAGASHADFELHTATVRAAADIDGALSDLQVASTQVIVVPNGAIFLSERHRIVQAINALKWPAVYGVNLAAEAGGLLCYGVNTEESYRRAAYFARRILSGSAVADLPVEQVEPRMTINLKTAADLGIPISPNVLARCDTIIE